MGRIMKQIINKTKAMKYIELTSGEGLETLLHRMYIEENKNIREIAKELDVHYNTVNKWLKLVGIQMRLPHEKMLELIEIKRKLREGV